MARETVKEECRIGSWQEVDDTMKQVAECKRVMVNLTNEMNEELEAVKKRFTRMAKPVQEKIDHYGADICQFVTEHRGEIKGKTKELNYGSTGFRSSAKLKYIKGVKAVSVVSTLLELNLKECVKTKYTIILGALKRQPVDVLDQIGAFVEKKDTFWYEVKREEIQPAKEQEVDS